jgi:mannose-6-phosphate isomerase-like protein (cupin superfamily)
MIWADNIEDRTEENKTFRTVLWTGAHSQLTVMSIPPGDDIGLEVHPDTDQFFRIEQGRATVKSGPARDDLRETTEVREDWAFIVPAGTWHNVVNTGSEPLKLYSVYAPANHPAGTVHATKADAERAEAMAHAKS